MRDEKSFHEVNCATSYQRLFCSEMENFSTKEFSDGHKLNMQGGPLSYLKIADMFRDRTGFTLDIRLQGGGCAWRLLYLSLLHPKNIDTKTKLFKNIKMMSDKHLF